MRTTLTLLLLCVFCTGTQAHLLKVFAYSQPDASSGNLHIEGKVYFAGGANADSASLIIKDNLGTKVKTFVTDELGKFKITLADANYQIIASTLDGHQAIWQINSQANILQVPNTDDVEFSGLSQQQLQSIIAVQLAAQIQPLSEQINALQDKARFQDIIGAIGYIFGFAGLFLWFRHAKDS